MKFTWNEKKKEREANNSQRNNKKPKILEEETEEELQQERLVEIQKLLQQIKISNETAIQFAENEKFKEAIQTWNKGMHLIQQCSYYKEYSNNMISNSNKGELTLENLEEYQSKIYEMRAQAYCEIGEYFKGIQDIDKCIEIQPRWSIAFRTRGRLLFNYGMFDLAVNSYKKALELQPDLDDVRFIDLPEAIELMEQVNDNQNE